MSIIPKKYHILIPPTLRRVYLEDGEDRGRAVIDGLKLEIATLTVRVVTLEHERKSSSPRSPCACPAVPTIDVAEPGIRTVALIADFHGW